MISDVQFNIINPYIKKGISADCREDGGTNSRNPSKRFILSAIIFDTTWLAAGWLLHGVEIKFSVSHPISDSVIITYFYITTCGNKAKGDITPMYRVSKSNFRRPWKCLSYYKKVCCHGRSVWGRKKDTNSSGFFFLSILRKTSYLQYYLYFIDFKVLIPEFYHLYTRNLHHI